MTGKPEFWDLDANALKLNTLQSMVVNSLRKYELTVFACERRDCQRQVTVRSDADLFDITISLRNLDERRK